MTGELFTGVDINALRGVHVVEPFASVSAHNQVEGRAARARGHNLLNNTNKNAVIYSYQATLNRSANTGWNSSMLTNKGTKFMNNAQKAAPSKIGGALTPAASTKVKMGREWLDSAMRHPSNTIRRSTNENMNYNQTLYPTPDEILRQERERGSHSKALIQFQQRLEAAVRGNI